LGITSFKNISKAVEHENIRTFENALESNSPEIAPSMIYA
jgi:hypothetical protein